MFTLDSTRERNLSIRISRRKRLVGDNPLQLHVIIDEPALRRPVLDPAGAREQLEYLLKVSEFTNVTLQIVPAAAAVHPGLRGGFSVLSFPQDTIGDLAYAEYAGGHLQIVNLDNTNWRKSSRSGNGGGNCVEVAFVPTAVAVRDSKNPTGPALAFPTTAWRGFLNSATVR